jgi:cobalt-zinc-cadmium efflux system membrane fusion protein
MRIVEKGKQKTLSMLRGVQSLCLGLCCLSVVMTGACQQPEESEPVRRSDKIPTQLVILTLEQQHTIGLTTAPAVLREIAPVLESFGRVIPRTQGRVQITSPVAGLVTPQSAEYIPTPGTIVRKGQLLAEVEQTYTVLEKIQLDVGEEEAEGVAQVAQATLEAAEADYRRSQQLFTAKIVGRKRVEEAKALLLQARSRYETAKRQTESYRVATTPGKNHIRRFPLLAPIDSVVVHADITAGQQVNTTNALFVLADSSTVWVEAPVFEGDLRKVQQPRPVVVTVSRIESETILSVTARPLFTSPVVDPAKRTAALVYEVKNTDGQLKLGMSVTVTIPIGPTTSRVMVPEAAVIENAPSAGVVYVRQSPTEFVERTVKLGERRDGYVSVDGNLAAGEELVVTGVAELFGAMPGRLVTDEE